CAALVELARAFAAFELERIVLTIAVVAFSLLMLFMGGRLIAPAAAGQFYRQGGNLEARVQPRIEGALIAVLLAAIVAAAVPGPRIVALAGAAALAVGGLLALVRLARWRLWQAQGRPDLACIGIGYAWVALGLVAWGIALMAGWHAFAMLHAITVGGLGTLTFNVMGLTWARLARVDPAASAVPAWGTALLAVAAASRIAADFTVAGRLALLALAAACWSAAFMLLLARFATLRRPARRPA
ncbi:MAG TPA: NnrS family protein, partial [Usitatibacter sp.]|nr:NnrS family protein [Usitatibacter sp.]